MTAMPAVTSDRDRPEQDDRPNPDRSPGLHQPPPEDQPQPGDQPLPGDQPPDQVDRIRAQWAAERPDVDTTPMAVVGRVSRVARALERRLDTVYARHAIESWEFDVLATLRRAGPPYERTPGELNGDLMISSGSTTNRIDRLAARGLVTRRPDARDRRSILVRLTPAGLAVVEAVMPEHMANESAILAGLSAAEQRALAALLRTLALSLDG